MSAGRAIGGGVKTGRRVVWEGTRLMMAVGHMSTRLMAFEGILQTEQGMSP